MLAVTGPLINAVRNALPSPSVIDITGMTMLGSAPPRPGGIEPGALLMIKMPAAPAACATCALITKVQFPRLTNATRPTTCAALVYDSHPSSGDGPPASTGAITCAVR